MLFEDIAGVKGGRVVVKDSKTRDTTTKEINIDGVAVTIAIDQSPRWGTIYRIWGIRNIPNSEIDMSTGWNSLDLLKKEAQKIIHKFYDSKTRDDDFERGSNKERTERAIKVLSQGKTVEGMSIEEAMLFQSKTKDNAVEEQFNEGDKVKVTQGMYTGKIAEVLRSSGTQSRIKFIETGTIVILDNKILRRTQDSKTRDEKTSHNYKGYVLEWDNENSNVRAVIKSPKGKIIYEYAKGAEPTFVGFQSKVDANISKTTDSLYKGQKVTAIKSEKGLRAGETYTVIRGEKPIAQSSEADIGTVYVLQDSTGNLVTVSGCEGLFYKTEDVNPIYSVRKNLRTGAIEYDKGGNWLPIEGKIKEAFENEQYIFSRTDKEGYAHYTVQVMDSIDTFTKGEALKVKIGEIQKNMDAARKMGYDTAQYQKEIDKLQKDSDIQESVVSELKRKGFKEWKRQYGEVFLSIGSKKLGTTYAQVDENGKIGGFSLQDFLRLPIVVNQISIGDDKDFKYKEENDKLQEDTYTGDPLTKKGKEIMKAMKEQYGEEEGEQVFYASKNKDSISGVDSKTKDNLLTPEMIKQLQQAYNRIERVDPSLPTYTKIITLLDRLSNEQLKQLSNAGIKFISGLARNRVKDAKTKDISEYRQGQIKGLRGWYSDYKKAKAHGNDNLAAEIMTNIEKELSITGIKKSEIIKDSKTKDEGVSLQTYRGKTFGITKKDGMFEAIFLFEENNIKAPSEQEVINKAKAKIDQFFKNRTGDKKQKEVR